MVFCDWHLSLSIRFSWFIHVVAILFFLLLSNISLHGYTTFIYLSLHGYLSCFHFLPPMNSAILSVCIQVFVEIYVFISLEYIPKSGIMVTLCLTI